MITFDQLLELLQSDDEKRNQSATVLPQSVVDQAQQQQQAQTQQTAQQEQSPFQQPTGSASSEPLPPTSESDPFQTQQTTSSGNYSSVYSPALDVQSSLPVMPDTSSTYGYTPPDYSLDIAFRKGGVGGFAGDNISQNYTPKPTINSTYSPPVSMPIETTTPATTTDISAQTTQPTQSSSSTSQNTGAQQLAIENQPQAITSVFNPFWDQLVLENKRREEAVTPSQSNLSDAGKVASRQPVGRLLPSLERQDMPKLPPWLQQYLLMLQLGLVPEPMTTV